MQNSYTAEVRSFVVGNFLLGRAEALDDDASFMDEGLIDSTGILELVSHLEESYGIEILEEELTPDNLDSVNRITAFLGRKLNHDAEAVQGRSAPLCEPASQPA
jgi:acyl carrier protein